MDRRSYLAATGAIVLAGCLGSSDGEGASNGGGGSDGGEASYSESNREDMILTESDFPSGWQRNEESSQDGEAAFQKNDGTLLTAGLEIHSSVEEANSRIDDLKNGFQDVTPIDFADEAFGGAQTGTAIVAFRHGNATAQIVGFRRSGTGLQPAYDASETYARKMYDKWQQI